MSAFRATWIALALGLVFLIPALPGPGRTPESPPAVDLSGADVVRIQIPGAQAGSLGPGVQVVEAYDSFVLARVTPTAARNLVARGLDVEPQDTYSMHVNGYVFDTRFGVTVPDALAAPSNVDGSAYYLVQFLGPIKEEWRWQLEATGLRVVGYLNNDAYVVKGTPQEIAAARTIGPVQWTGAYHPAFRISPDLLAATGTTDVNIIAFDGDPLGPIVSTLNKMGYGFIGRWADGPGILEFSAYDGFGLVRARVDAADLVPVARLNVVRYIEPYVEMQTANSQEQFVLQSNASAEGGAEGSAGWLSVRTIFSQNIRGQGQTVAVIDTGVDFDHTMFRHTQTTARTGDIYNVTSVPANRKVVAYRTMSQYNGIDPWTGGDPQAYQDSGAGFCTGNGGQGHGTETSGSAVGDDSTFTPQSPENGMAPAAKLVMVDIGGLDAQNCDSLKYIPSDYGLMYRDSYNAGARMFSNSWGGSSNNYDIGASMVDRFMWNYPDALILFANGNNPPNALVGSPGTAKNVVSVSGAQSWTTSGRENMGAASRGPTADGRLKPEITTFFSTAGGGTSLSDGVMGSYNSGITGFSGTSYATPLAAGMAALARQYFIQGWYPNGRTPGVAIAPSAALLKALLVASSQPMGSSGACPVEPGGARYPNNAQGWGRLWLDNGLYFANETPQTKKLFVADSRAGGGVNTGDSISYRVSVQSSSSTLRVALAWSDYPGIEGANPAIVNNLDLEVTDPSGTVYKGNVRGPCASAQTVGGGTFDVRNTTEGVVRRSPPAGVWIIRVIGANVPFGPQRFGLVVLADLDRTYGTVDIDKTVYSESDIVNIQVTDSDATAPVSVQVTSPTEPGGETVTLTEPVAGGSIWRSFIRTNYGVPTPGNGRIEVSCGDIITVTYNDGNPPHSSTATARIDCDYPVISNVRVSGISNSAATVTWTTDRPADSRVDYDTSFPFGSFATDTAATTSHSVPLTNLNTDTVYYFDVTSARLGHATRDDNGGRHYSFKTSPKAEILLVIADTSFPANRVENDTDALSDKGWAYNTWYVAQSGDPPLTTLQEYKAVLWEVGLEQYPPIPDATAPLLKTYIDGGGRLYVNGHDVGWSACDTGSSYFTNARCNFVRSILKYQYASDPTTVAGLVGFAGDQISGAYTGGLTYVQHRSGGAADEGTLLSVGGTTTYVWRTNTGDIPPNAGVKWISSADNGTANPSCVWCGAPSRVAFFAFEFTGISGTPINGRHDPIKADILNKTITFLLGRSPPVVRVSSPNGGETISTNTLPVSWQHSAVASQAIWYSQDSGQSWSDTAQAVGPGDVSANLDITDNVTWPNGNQYMIRVVVADAGTPSFTAQDASDNTFTINRPGGDVIGPVVRAGSLRVSPNPARNDSALVINATVDDSLTGYSNIDAAEYFVQATMPTPLDYGFGFPMSAPSGFNTPVEAVTATYAVTQPSGSVLTIWVHGRDAAVPTRNWGSFGGGNSTGGSRMTLVIPGSTTPIPLPPTGVTAILTGPTFADVRIQWTIPSGPSIDKFQVYFSSTYSAARAGYALLADNIGATTTSWDHVTGGSGNANNYFYYVRAVNLGGGADSATQAAKFTRGLSAGWQLVSIPLTLQDTSITGALQTLQWRTARTYVATDPVDQWKAWYTVKGNGDLRTVSTGMALWVDVSAAKDFTVAGQVPASTAIQLRPNTWNFVGYASFNPQAASATLSAFGLRNLEIYQNAPQYYLTTAPLTTVLQPGQGYWIYVTLGGTWTVNN